MFNLGTRTLESALMLSKQQQVLLREILTVLTKDIEQKSEEDHLVLRAALETEEGLHALSEAIESTEDKKEHYERFYRFISE